MIINHLRPPIYSAWATDPNNTQAAREPIPTKEEAHERLVSLIKGIYDKNHFSRSVL